MSGEGAEDPDEIGDDEIERLFDAADAKTQEKYLRSVVQQNSLALHLIRCGFQPEEIEMALDKEEMVVFVYVKPKG